MEWNYGVEGMKVLALRIYMQICSLKLNFLPSFRPFASPRENGTSPTDVGLLYDFEAQERITPETLVLSSSQKKPSPL